MDKNKEQHFECATKKLIAQLDSMGLDKTTRMQAKNLVLLFRDSFKLDAVKYATFAHTTGDEFKLFTYDSDGFCKAASCSFIGMMNNPKEWRLMYINEVWAYGPHFFVQHIPSGQAFDLTYDQYEHDGISVPYYIGRPIKMNGDAKDTAKRFLQSAGIDFVPFAKFRNIKE